MSRLRSVAIEVTNYCNARCVYCPNRFMKRPRGFMEYDLYKKIVDEIVSIDSVTTMSCQMNGESTLDKDLVKKLKYVKSKNPKFIVHLITNGSFITEEIMELVHHIDLSFNYADPKMYNENTGLDYETIKSNVFKLDKFRDKITIHCVMAKGMKEDFGRLQEIFRGYKVVYNPAFNDWNNKIEDLSAFKLGERLPVCELLRTQMCILWNGDGIICCADYDGETSKYIGNIKDKSVMELFNCSYMNEMREKERCSNLKGTFCENCNVVIEVLE